MTLRRITADDYADEHPEIEDTADQLRSETDPRLVARFTREYWWSVEYVMWDGTRWYGCVQNHTEDGWETTDVGEYSKTQLYSSLADVRENDYGLNLVPVEDTPLDDAQDGGSA